MIFETLEPRNYLTDATGWYVGIGDSNHDGRTDNRDLQSALCHRATAVANLPAAGSAYQYATGPLFAAGGPVYTDAMQGGLGDCGLIAALAEVAYKDPRAIENMFVDNFDSTYTVRFWDNQDDSWHSTIIDNELPSGYASYANVLWVALAEKAYAQMNIEGWLDAETNGVDAYYAIAGTYYFDAVNQTTSKGLLAFNFPGDPGVQASFSAAVSAGKMIGMATNGAGTTGGVVANHEYAVLSYDAPTQTVTMYNPWGRVEIYDWHQIEDNVAYISWTV